MESTTLRRDGATGRQDGGVLVSARPGTLRRRQEFETTDGEDLWTYFVMEQTNRRQRQRWRSPARGRRGYAVLSVWIKKKSQCDEM